MADVLIVTDKNIEDLISGEEGKELREALKDKENKDRLKKFIDNIEKLWEEHGLLIDLIGQNLFFYRDEQGKLGIKVIDYGCTEKKFVKDKSSKQSVKQNLETIEGLKKLLK